ncbi:hypothetical protein MKX01_029253 [Papaver californicum]|nr:hypothetical protein MKX01_029253 [Papaver californicum]
MISDKSCSNRADLRFFGEVQILCEILSRLPVKSLVRFKSVCSDWQWLIEKDSNFINLHLTHSKSTSLEKNDINSTSLLVFPLYINRSAERMFLFSAEEVVLFNHPPSGSSSAALVPGESLLSCRNIIDTDFRIPMGVRMLKPVNGLICFHNPCFGSVLIYNPSTRERTSWIKSIIEKEHESGICSHGFGFDPTTREHKVVCINVISRITTSVNDPAVVSYVKEFVCEVLTVGENKWRKIDEVPSHTFRMSAYVNGYIYWIGNIKSAFTKAEVILGFDVGSEKFNRVIKIPNFMLDLWNIGSTRLSKELVEVDGHLAIIDIEEDSWINLWIYNDDEDTCNSNVNACDGNWIKEAIPMPCAWDGKGYLAFEHIPGTDLIILKSFPKPIELECLYFYSRDKKKYYGKQVEFITTNNASSNRTRLPDRGYHITSFFQTLLRVEAKTW